MPIFGVDRLTDTSYHGVTSGGRASQATSPHIVITEFHKFFIDKIAGIRVSTDDATSPVYRPTSDPALEVFQPVDVYEMSRLTASLSCKVCRNDPLPTWRLKECSVELAPYICRLCNASLRSGHVRESFKIAHITTLLKKGNLDSSDNKNYRPISNLSVIGASYPAATAGTSYTQLYAVPRQVSLP